MSHSAMTRVFSLLTLIVLASCAQPFERRVAARLQDAGIPGPTAQCMAERWVNRLSLMQLRKIEQLSSALKEQYRNRGLTVFGFIDEVRRLDDPEIIRVVTASAAICALKA